MIRLSQVQGLLVNIMIEIKRPVILFREWTDISLNEYMYNNH